MPRENSARADLWFGHFQILFPFPQLRVLALKIHFLFIHVLPPFCCLLEFLRSVRQFDRRHLHNDEARCSGWLKCTYKGFCGTKEETCGRGQTVLGGRSSVLRSQPPHELWGNSNSSAPPLFSFSHLKWYEPCKGYRCSAWPHGRRARGQRN